MRSSRIRITAVATATLLATAALAGCTIKLGANNSDQGPGMMGAKGKAGSTPSATDFSGYDIMFAQMMIPHHQQAVDMGTLAETRAFSSEVKALAAQIKAEQAPEIIQMQGWLTDAGQSMDMGHAMGMGGMLSESEMTALKAAKGAAFDKLYLEGMIAHHEGAIHMAQMVIDSTNAESRALGEAIIASQTKQIEYMKSLLAK